jgi:hypothetical protein
LGGVRRRAAACLAGAVLPATAPASDTGLKKTVVRYERRVKPLATRWNAADKALPDATSTDSASAATGAFRRGLHQWKVAVTPIKTQTASAAGGKKELLTAIREFDLGLVQYQKALDKLSSGASKDSLKATLTRAVKRINAAADDEEAALKELGLVK